MRRRLALVLLMSLALMSCGQPLATTSPHATRSVGPRTPQATRIVSTPATPGIVESPPAATAAPPIVEATATLVVTLMPSREPTPDPTVVVVPQLPTPSPLLYEQRWRAQQAERQVFEPRRVYVARSRTPLFWYDPATGQTLAIGDLLGDFIVQAQFKLRDGDRPALEVPYLINQDFGLTSISEALRQRMASAGYTESVEAYVVQSDVVQPK